MSQLSLITSSNSYYGEVLFRNTNTYTGSSPSTSLAISRTPRLDFELSTSYTWKVPEGVSSISVVCIGGGGSGDGDNGTAGGCGGGGGALSYVNNIPVVPQEELTVYVGKKSDATSGFHGEQGGAAGLIRGTKTLVFAAGGGGGAGSASDYGMGGNYIIGTGFYGGNGGTGGSSTGGEGGGAGQFASNGADGLDGNRVGASGTGTLPYGFDTGSFFLSVSNTRYGYPFGGGGGGANDETSGGVRQNGTQGGESCVRIIWGGGRGFPSFGAGESFSNGNVTNIDVANP